MTTRDVSLDNELDRNCDFNLVEHKFMTNPCTPPIGEDEINVIRINAPEIVCFDADPSTIEYLDERNLTFYLCGNCAFSAGIKTTLGIEDHFTYAMIYTASDINRSISYSGQFPIRGSRMQKPAELKSNVSLPSDLIIGERFNPNLAEVFQLPPVETEYFIHVSLGPYKSNILKVAVKQKIE